MALQFSDRHQSVGLCQKRYINALSSHKRDAHVPEKYSCAGGYAGLKALWIQIAEIITYIGLRAADADSVAPAYASYFRHLGVHLEHETMAQEALVAEDNITPRVSLIATALLLNTVLYAVDPRSPAVLSLLERLCDLKGTDGKLDLTPSSLHLWVLLVGASCAEANPDTRRFLLRHMNTALYT